MPAKQKVSAQQYGEWNIGILGSLIPVNFDYIALTYTGDNPTTIVYKTGGSGGTTVATLTLVWDGTKVTSVTRT